jgi:hypothetical protein
VSSTNTRVLAAVALLITFLVGATLGIVGDRIFIAIHPPRRTPEMIVRHLTFMLRLSDQQRAQVTDIVRRHQQRIAAIQSTTRPAIQQELEQANNEIERILTPEQRRKFERIRMRLMRHGPAASRGD